MTIGGSKDESLEKGLSRRLESGMKLIAGLPEIMPEQAGGRVRLIYEDIQATLRVPFVNFIFRVLANYPDFITTAWTNFAPFLRTLALERAADRLRSSALLEPVPNSADVHWSAVGELERIRPFTDTIHYVLPKLLLVATAFDEGLRERDAPRGNMEIPAAGIPYGVAAGATRISMVDPAAMEGELPSLFRDIKEKHQHPGVASYYRSLGHWPKFLEAVWTRVEPLVGSPAYKERKEALVESATRIISDLPWPSLLWVRAFNTLNLSWDDTEEVGAVLSVFRLRLIPDLLLDVSVIKAMLDGPGVARASPFSAAAKPVA